MTGLRCSKPPIRYKVFEGGSMKFKDMVKDDVWGVFMNQDEYAETYRWNGGGGSETYEIVAVLDDDILIKKYSSEFEFLEKGSHMLFAAADQFKRKPKAGDAVRFDGALYTVDRLDEDMGMYTIFLAKGRG